MTPGFLPHEPESGLRPSRGDVVGTMRAVQSRRIVESADIMPIQGLGGTALVLKRRAPPPLAQGLPPLHVYSRSTPADGWRIGVTPGRVYSANYNFTPLVPRLGGTALDAPTRPVAEVTADEMNVYLHLTMSTSEIVVPPVTIDLVDAEDEQPASDFLNGYLHVATVTREGNEDAPLVRVEALLSGHRAHRKVNVTHLWGAL